MNRKMIKSVGSAFALSLLTGSAFAEVVRVDGRVQASLVDDTNFGGCMVLLDTQATGNNCTTSWVSFSCTGDFNSPATGFKKYDTAVLGQFTGNRIAVFVDDARKHNGHCYAIRVDVNTFN